MSYIYITDRTYLKKIKDIDNIELCNIGTENYFYSKLIRIYSDEDLKIPEKYKKLELISECENDPDLTDLRSKFIEYCTGYKNVSIVTNKEIGTQKCIYTFITGNEEIYIKIKDFDSILEYLSKFCKGDFYISHIKKYSDFYHQILLKSDKELPLKRINDFLFSKNNKYKENIKNIINDLDIDIYQTNKPEEMEKIFNKEAIHIPEIKIEDFKRNNTIRDMTKSKGDEFLIHSNEDELNNFKKVENNILPSYPVDDSIKLDLSRKLNNLENPMYTPSKLVDMLSEGEVKFINYNDFTDILSPLDDKDIIKYKNDDLEKTCCLIHKLENLDVDYLMIPDLDGYEVFYKNDKPIENDTNLEDCKKETIRQIFQNSNNKEDLEKYPLSKLKNIYYHNGFSFPIDQNNMSFTNPYDKSILPLEIIHSCNCGINGLELKNNDPHERINIDIPAMFNIYNKEKNNVEIELISPVGKKIISEDFCVNENQRPFLQNSLDRMWKKGYFLNDYGLAYYDKYGKIPENSIESPWWFKSDNIEKSKEILSFISQI